MITENQVDMLRRDAIDAGDLAMVVICDRALGSEDVRDDATTTCRPTSTNAARSTERST